MDWIPIGECDIQSYTATEKAALALLNEGKNYFTIASKLRCSFESAREIVFSIRKKESLIMGKLTNTQRAAIFQAWKDGTTPKELAKQYGVSVKSIYNLINKMTKEPPQELEDVENGIPNTPLLPQKFENADKNTAIAEQNSENAAPEKLPDFILDAVENQMLFYERWIDNQVKQIAEQQAELQKLEAKRQKLADWLEAHT